VSQGLFDGFVRVPDRSHDFQVLPLLEQTLQAQTDDFMVVNQENSKMCHVPSIARGRLSDNVRLAFS